MLRMLRPIASLLIAVFLMQACSLFREKPPEYLASEDGAPLKVPDDLDAVRYVRPIAIGVEEMRMPSGDELNPGPPKVVSTGGGGDTNAFMAWSASGVYLMVKDTPESVARRLRFAIQRSGMNLLERDDAGEYLFEYIHLRTDDRGFFQKMLFWRKNDGPNFSGTYRTRLEPNGEQTRVYLMYGTGRAAVTGAAEYILGIFMERLG